MKPNPDDRDFLSEKPLESDPAELVHEAEWIAEINKRVEEIREGSARLVSTEDMLREALDALQ